MIDNKKVLAIIPARGGSKRIPKKNLKAISGKPMILYTIEAAKECKYIDKVIVSTDDEEIAAISMKAGAVVPFRRPEEFSGDGARLIDVLLHAVEFYEHKGERYDIIVLLLPSSPLRTGEDIHRSLDFFLKNGQRSVVSISAVNEHPALVRQFEDKNKLVRLLDQEMAGNRLKGKRFYKVNGAIYINRALELDEHTNLDNNELGYVLPKDRGLNIQEPEDAVVADFYVSKNCDAEYLSFIVY